MKLSFDGSIVKDEPLNGSHLVFRFDAAACRFVSGAGGLGSAAI
jgi:hypothetical protein